MAAIKNKRNLLQSRDTYSRYYGDFRGVDFSNDHTQVHEQRLAYLCNMYKDYQSGQGKALETIPGFRRRVELPYEEEIYGIHRFEYKNTSGKQLSKVLIHAGDRLYFWHNYPKSVNVEIIDTITLPEPSEQLGEYFVFKIGVNENVEAITSLKRQNGEDVTINIDSFDRITHVLTITRSDLFAGENLQMSYFEGTIKAEDALFVGLNRRRSTSFIFNNRLYFIDGKNYLVYDGETIKDVVSSAYIPTTYINIIPNGENADIGTEYEQRNILQPLFKHTFVADGTTTEFYMNECDLDEISEVKLYGKTLTEGVGKDYSVDLFAGKITFSSAPPRPENAENGAYPEFFAGVEITAKKVLKSVSGVTEEKENIFELVTECTIATIFDNRVFMSGNPNYPNHVFYCGRNITGYVDPTYFGVLNYMQDGVGTTQITGMMPVADTLLVLKGDTRQDGSSYFHTPNSTGNDLQPRVYPSTQGLNGIGSLGACINFLDDPIFISRLGVEAIGQLSVRYERGIEHRSSLIDAKLVNCNLKNAAVEEWNGYLMVLVDGKIFMADSRQRYTHEIGVPQYEWYYLEGIGVYKGQYKEYKFSSRLYSELKGKTVRYCTNCKNNERECTCGNHDGFINVPIKLADAVYYGSIDETKDLRGEAANPPKNDGSESGHIFEDVVKVSYEDVEYGVNINYTVHEVYSITEELVGYEAYLCESHGNSTGGVFKKACVIRNIDDNVFFGTENGVICSFNFDMRDSQGEIAPQNYSFDGRTILCGCATKMDCCGVPHLNKNTVKKSTVIKTKSFPSSAAKIRVRTNRKPYAQIGRINSTLFTFDGMDFSDFSFITTEQSLFAIKEKEKKWVEKQYYIYSDEYMKPFALFYISFRYQISGRYKE